MFEYARIYEQFRPNRITKDDVYFGTVKKMDGIYNLNFTDHHQLFTAVLEIDKN